MFHYIKGNLAWVAEDYVVIDSHGVGYKIYTSDLSISAFERAQEPVIAYTHMILREDAIYIYGFATREELKIFDLLISVTGVGAKVALGILSSIPMNILIKIIISEDVQSLTKAQGVGKKTAQRIILELKDKLDEQIEMENQFFSIRDEIGEKSDVQEAISALVALGYGKGEASKVIKKVQNSCENIEEMIKNALRLLAR